MALTREQTKIMAILLMVIDHASIFFLNNNIFFRTIGRLSFPLFVYLLADGFCKTHDIEKFARRLIFAWAISIVPYSWAFYNQLIVPQQNVFVSLYLYLCLFCVLGNRNISQEIKWGVAFVIALIAWQFHVMYSWYGVGVAVLCFAKADDLPACYGQAGEPHDWIPINLKSFEAQFSWMCLLGILYYIFGESSYIQIFACFTVLLYPYEGRFVKSEKPNKVISVISYLFYPLHLVFFRLCVG